MNTITDYLAWRGDITFEQAKFNDVDAAVLCKFCYQPLHSIVKTDYRNRVSISEACNEMLNFPELEKHLIDYEVEKNFLIDISKSDRFKNVRIINHINEIDIDNQTQFSATVFEYEEGMYFIAFRGTDTTLIAWKENFNMGFEFPVPAQEKAKEYLEKTLRNLKDGSFIVGGHSKGGNLAIYSAVFCDSIFQRPISKIYNFDGPGFTDSIVASENYKKMEKDINSFVPSFSIVGMILEHQGDYSVVNSIGNAAEQHDLLNWGVTRDGFLVKEEVHAGSKIIDSTLKEWLNNLSLEEREVFVNTLYNVIINENIETLSDIEDNPIDVVLKAIKTYSQLDKSVKHDLKGNMKSLIKVLSSNIKNINKE